MPDTPEDDVVGIAANEPPAPIFHVNSLPHVWRAGMTLADVVRDCADDGTAVATAINGRFVARDERPATAIVPGDAILLFAAIVGG